MFKAINDSGRRRLLDALHERDGQSLIELCRHIPDITRQGVMNHLRILEDGGLVASHKSGREKFHYLNPVPIRLIHDRWINKFAEPRVGALAELTTRLEQGTTMNKPAHIYKTYIRATVDDVWNAIVDGDQTVQYYYGTRVQSDWQVGSSMNYHDATGGLVSEGEIIAIDPPNRIEFTFQALWNPALVEEGPVREVWSIRDANGMVELTIELFDLAVGGATYDDFVAGLPYIVAGLKSLLETGTPLPAPS